jgi:putative DNA primase/helicase
MIPKKHDRPPFKKDYYIKKFGDFIKAWRWYDKKGNWLFCTVRFEKKKDKKTTKNVIPFSYENKWIAKQLIDTDRPLMDLHIITKNPEKYILLVEGEKCYDAAKEKLESDFITTTWCGGTSAINKTDWKPLKNRPVYYWFDHDDPGYKTVDYLRTKLEKLILVQPPIDKPKGWDIADAIQKENWNDNDLLLFIRQFSEIEVVKKEKRKKTLLDEVNTPFTILGYNMGYMFFLPKETCQIYKIKKGSLTNQHLLELAPLEFWENTYGEWKKSGFRISWINAQDDVIRQVNNTNPFSPDNVRGRGVWKEKNKIIIHTGKHLYINNNCIDVQDYCPNGHVYERLPELKLNIVNEKLTEQELKKVISCFRRLSIKNKLELNYLVGWCVLAPFCGALDWRPHIWITGAAGSGKSAIVHMIIHKMLGNFIFCPEGDSSGAGIIQGLKNDSLPVVHDEIDKTSVSMQNIEVEMSITRSSSSSSEKTSLYKGTADQIGKKYNYNSMFCFSSINLYLNKKSDKSRFSIINLEKNELIKWTDLKKQIIETFNKKICSKIRSKIYYNWDVVIHNVNLFKDVVGVIVKDQRTGDQIGTLLAGAASLIKMEKYDRRDAYNLCEDNLKKYYNEDDILTDEIECLLTIFTTQIKMVVDNKIQQTTLLNLLNLASGNNIDNTPDPFANKELWKYGIKYDDKKNKVYIACRYKWIKDILKDTAWINSYNTILKRLSFVSNKTEVVYFGSFYTGRALEIKADHLLRLSDDQVYMESGID